MAMSLQHFALGVPDLKAGADFYTTFGMNVREDSYRLGLRCDNRPHDEIVLIETGKDRKFDHISFSADDSEFKQLEIRLAQNNIEILARPDTNAYDGLWFRDPDGNLVNVQQSEPPSLPEEPRIIPNSPGIYDRVDVRGCPPFDIDPRPRRFGHMILFSTDPESQARFYADVVGLQISDRIVGNFAVFLRMPGSSDHHVLGFMASAGTGFHHASFEMRSIDEAVIAGQRILGKDYRHAWGPGRHGVGSNYFNYFRDPWNGLSEYFWDIDYISADCDWQAEEWTKKDGMFLWSASGPPPEDFGRNYELD